MCRMENELLVSFYREKLAPLSRPGQQTERISLWADKTTFLSGLARAKLATLNRLRFLRRLSLRLPGPLITNLSLFLMPLMLQQTHRL